MSFGDLCESWGHLGLPEAHRPCVVLAAFLGASWRPLCVLRASLDPLWGSFGAPWGDIWGSLEVLLAAVGCLGGPLRIPAGTWVVLGRLGGDFRDFPGNFGRPFGSILAPFLLFFRSFFGLRFLLDF